MTVSTQAMAHTNLAVALQTDETKVVVVDASFQFGDLGVFFNLKNKYNLVSATSRADELDEDFVQSVLTAHPSGVKVLLGPATPEDAEVVMPVRGERARGDR